jgi:2-methylcitrate dehydratase PrpD
VVTFLMWATEILAQFVSTWPEGNIPERARETAKRCVLDLVGAAAAGFSTAGARALREGASTIVLPGPASVWFSGTGLHAAGAALANSGAASALDLDDGHRAAGGHPGACIIPAAFTVAEAMKSTGANFLGAVILGYEVAVRVAAARDFSRLDTLSTGRWCAYGVVAAAGRLLGVTPAHLTQAMAIAGVLSPGLSAAGYSSVMGNQVKEGIPWAAFLGLVALDLAQKGLTGPTDILDHPAYYDRDRIVGGLGQRFAIEEVYFKPYACCRWIHSALDGLLSLMTEHGLRGEEVRKATVFTFERALRLNNYADPTTLEAAQYSIPFCVATAALAGKEALRSLPESLLGRPDIVELAKRVELRLDPELDRRFPLQVPARVTLETGRGRFEQLVDHPRGDPANPMDLTALVEKFRRLSTGLLTPAEQDATIAAVLSLEQGGFSRLATILVRCR